MSNDWGLYEYTLLCSCVQYSYLRMYTYIQQARPGAWGRRRNRWEMAGEVPGSVSKSTPQSRLCLKMPAYELLRRDCGKGNSILSASKRQKTPKPVRVETSGLQLFRPRPVDIQCVPPWATPCI